MLALAIDTATEICSIALGNREHLIDETSFVAGRSHLEMLLPALERLLARQGLSVRQLEQIVAGTGPGTFSGLRVGVATCRALSQALAIPIAGSSSLAALAAGAASCLIDEQQNLAAVINARRGQVFARLYRKSKRTVFPASAVYCLKPEELVEVVTVASTGPVVAAGDGVIAYKKVFYGAAGVRPLPPEDERHQVRSFYHLPGEKSRMKYSAEALLKVLPAYIREPDADKTVLLRKKGTWQ